MGMEVSPAEGTRKSWVPMESAQPFLALELRAKHFLQTSGFF